MSIKVIRQSIVISFLVVFVLLTGMSDARACGVSEQILFQCKFEDTPQEVTVCLGDDAVRYALGKTGEEPTVQVSQSIDDIVYGLRDVSGKVSYELGFYTDKGTHNFIFPPSTDNSTTMSIVSNTKPRLDYTCDPSSIVPQNPSEGVGQLTALLADGKARLAACRQSQEYKENPTACIGRIHKACKIIFESTGQHCTETEIDVWGVLMDEALAKVIARYDDAEFTAKIKDAQKIWASSSAADCAIAGGAVFNSYVPETGEQECLVYMTAQRVRLLEAIAYEAHLR